MKIRTLLLVTLVTAAAGCRSRVTGNEGNLSFSYVADDRVGDFNKPIAVGARLDLTVEEAGRLSPVPVVKAESATPQTLGVVETRGSVVVVEGLAPGSALLEVEATVAGVNLPDSVNLLVAEPEVLKLRHPCTDSRTGRYFVNQEVLVPFDMERANGQPVIGYGRYPVTFEPEGVVTLDTETKAQSHLPLLTGASPATVTVRSTIDDTTLEMVLVTPAQLSGGRMLGDPAHAVPVGRKGYRLVWPTVGGEPVCQPKVAVSVVGTTPEICAVSAMQTAREDDEVGETLGWVEIDGQRAGTCSFDVTWEAGNDGAGVTERFDVPVK